jgi:hypothetical protein
MPQERKRYNDDISRHPPDVGLYEVRNCAGISFDFYVSNK